MSLLICFSPYEMYTYRPIPIMLRTTKINLSFMYLSILPSIQNLTEIVFRYNIVHVALYYDEAILQKEKQLVQTPFTLKSHSVQDLVILIVHILCIVCIVILRAVSFSVRRRRAVFWTSTMTVRAF